MRAIKGLIGLFPKDTRKKMRQHLWLYNLYGKSLQKSGLFYGFPTPQKLQKLYTKNMVQQSQDISHALVGFVSSLQLNCLIVLTGKDNSDLTTLQNIIANQGISKVFVTGDKRVVDKVLRHNWEHSQVRPCKFEDVLPSDLNAPLLLIRSGDELHPKLIDMFEYTLSKLDATDHNTESLAIYCDTDSVDKQNKRHLAEFLPNWDPDLQLTSGYIKTGVLVSGSTQIAKLQTFTKQHTKPTLIALWMAQIYLEQSILQIAHIPYCLVHQAERYEYQWHTELLRLHPTQFSIKKGPADQVASLIWRAPAAPLVSLVIPTKNAKGLVENCINSILQKTTYLNYEIILVDNNSDDPESLAYFAQLNVQQPKVKVVKYPKPFNYSAINNFAVAHASGDIVGLVNNDIEVISEDWLTHMVGHVTRTDIGCVGAKLLYPDGRIQHAGVVMGYGGGAGHAHKYFPRYHPGYLHRLHATNSYSAVTAACLLVKKVDYLAVGGLNESDLTVAFNDVDFCLRVLTLGKRNLYCAEAVLYHYESISRGLDDTPSKRARFEKELDYLQTTWASYILADPAYNLHLTLRHENFSIKEK